LDIKILMETSVKNFDINDQLNKFNIRILNTYADPYFYGYEIGDILGIKNIRNSVRNFDESEIVSAEDRIKNNIITYSPYKGKMRKDDKVILIKEYGLHRLIINSNSAAAKDFRNYIYKTIRDKRLESEIKLNMLEGKDNTIETNNKYIKSQEELDQYKKFVPMFICYKIEINDDPYKHIESKHKSKDQLCDYKTEFLYLFVIDGIDNGYYISKYTTYAKIFGTKEYIYEKIAEYTLTTNENAMLDNIYYTTTPPDEIFDNIDGIQINYL
jgi:prophage antirepressor-like protein